MVDRFVTFKAIVDNNKEIFLNDIKKATKYDDIRNYRRTFPDFPLIYSGKDEYYMHSWYIKHLECCIREDLVKKTLEDTINMFYSGKCSIVSYDTKGYENFNNQGVEDFYIPVEFIITTDKETIGYRFSEPNPGSIPLFKKTFNLDRIDVIDCYDFLEEGKEYDDEIEGYTYGFKNFFTQYLTVEEYNYFIKTSREAVKEANERIGFSSVPRLTFSNIYSFKRRILEKILKSFDYSKIRYQVIETNGKRKQLDGWKLGRRDYEILSERLVKSRAFEVLVGESDFAKCFVTAEYMFEIFNKEDLFDYTSIVAGYLKCIELILYKIVQIIMKTEKGKQYFITANLQKLKKQNELMRNSDLIQKGQYKWIRLLPKYKNSFKLEMGSLIAFLDEKKGNTGIWRIESKMDAIKLLQTFNQECRNEHFHKDVITNYKKVEVIRSNTILLAAILLGGCELTGSLKNDLTELGITSITKFERLYARLQNIPSSVTHFLFEFDDGELIKAYRLFEQEDTQYDKEDGSIKDSVIKFAIVEDNNNMDCVEVEEKQKERLLILSIDNIPQNVWVLKSGEKKELIEW